MNTFNLLVRASFVFFICSIWTSSIAESISFLKAHCTRNTDRCASTHGKYLHSNSPENGGTSWGRKRSDIAWIVEYSPGEQSVYLRAHCTSNRNNCSSTHGKYFHSNSPEGRGTSWGRKRSDIAWKIEYSKGPGVKNQIIYLKAHCTNNAVGCTSTHGKYLHSNSPEGGGTSWGIKRSDLAWIIE